jgi:plastocyanin
MSGAKTTDGGQGGVKKLKRFLLALTVGATFLFASGAFGAPQQISIDDNVFSPDNPPVKTLAAGPTFNWKSAPTSDRRHNVREDHKLFFSGALTTADINYSVSASAGTFHYYCELHGDEVSGMDGFVKVRPSFTLAPAGNPFTVSWALPGTTTGNRFDVRYRQGTTGPFTMWKNDTSARSGVFGQGGQPVAVVPGRTYQFQALSEKVPSQPSGWSPAQTVHVPAP